MFNGPYGTTILQTSKLDFIPKLELAKMEGVLISPSVSEIDNLYIVVGNSPAVKVIPPFHHPVMVRDRFDSSFFIDLRAFNSQVYPNGNFKLPTEGPAALLIRRARLQQIWLQEGGPKQLSMQSDFPLSVFADWVSRAISSKLSLDNLELQGKLHALTAWYYQCLFYPKFDPSETLYRSNASKIKRISSLGSDAIYELISDVGYLGNIADFTAAFAKLNSVRLNGIGPSEVYNLLVGGWYGSAESSEILAVALEYPPTFIAVLYTATVERGYRKLPIATLANETKRRDAAGAFIRAINSTLRQ